MSKTLLEISKEIGVSTATISRVLNGESNVSAETRERVLAAINESGYEKRSRRRSAELRNTDTVMIIAGQLQNPITLGFIDGIRKRLAAEGLRCVISLSDYNTATECDTLDYAAKNGFAGIFLLNAIESRGLIERLSGIRTPVIFVNRYLRQLDTDVVTIDNYRCGYMAAKYLLERGHQRIAHIAGPITSMTCRDRTQGFIDAMRSSELALTEPNIFYGDRSYKSGCEFGRYICELARYERPTAVFATTGLMAAGMVDVLRKNGIRVPDDVSVICNDDYSRDYIPCPIDFTTVAQDSIVMGQTAAELMLERAADPSLPPRRIVFPPILTEHNSVVKSKA